MIDRAFWGQLRGEVNYTVEDVCVAPKDRDQRHELTRKQILEARSDLHFRSQVIPETLQTRGKALPFMVE